MAQISTSNLRSNTGQPIVIQVVGNGIDGSTSTGEGCVKDVSTYSKRLAAILGSLHICFGVLSIAFSAAAQHYRHEYYTFHIFLWGYWTPVLWLIAGGFGLGTACVKNKCLIITFMTMSIISACSMISYLTFAGLEQAVSVYYKYNYYDNAEKPRSEKVPLDGVVVAVGLCEGIVSIFSAVVCCSAVCCRASKTTVNAHTMEQIRQIMNEADASQGATAQTLQTKGHDNIELQEEPPTAQSCDNDNPPLR